MAKRESKNSIEIAGHTIKGGESRIIELPIADLYTHTPLTIPVKVVCGRRPGPNLFVSAAMHGDEINGVEIVRRLLASKNLAKLRGCLVAVPILNVHGFITHSRYLPDGRDLNRCFPGNETGSLASRLAWMFTKEIVARCRYGIDLHTASGARFNLPQVRCNIRDEATIELAQSFGAPVVLNANIRDGSLRQEITEKERIMLLYEAGEALRFDEISIRMGVAGITSVMRKLGMLPGRPYKSRFDQFTARSSTWVRAPQSGIFRVMASLGDWVRSGDLLGVVSDPMGENESEIKSPCEGLVISLQKLPLANTGDALIHIARKEPGQDRPDDMLEYEENHIVDSFPSFN